MKRIRMSPIDAVALVGLVLLTVGATLVYVPLGFIVPGVLLLLYAIAASRVEVEP